jgi:aspartate racemase
LRRRGFEVLVPDDAGLAQCVAAIEAVKGNQPQHAFAPAAQCIRALIARGAQAVVLGCTELPLALPHDKRGEFDVVLTDSIDALAKEALARYGHDFQH